MEGSAPKRILIDPLSARSLLLELYGNGNLLSTATGFVVQCANQPYLITNWHVVSGVNPDTGVLLLETGAVPDQLSIVHHAAGQLGTWIRSIETLYDENGGRRWLEHPLGRAIDTIALPLRSTNQSIELYPLDLSLAETDMVVSPAMMVSIIGYPYGLATAGSWPIWKTGHIASDIDLDYDDRPAFLIDATTRGGMSGSPVVHRSSGGYYTQDGSFVMATGGVATRFLGIYSGRIHGQAEIGRVWRPYVISKILEEATNQ